MCAGALGYHEQLVCIRFDCVGWMTLFSTGLFAICFSLLHIKRTEMERVIFKYRSKTLIQQV